MSVDAVPGDTRPKAAVQSVDRAISIMEILARDGWSGVTEISKELEVHKSTVFRLMATLEARGIVEQHAGSQKYRLGFAMVRLAAGISGDVDLAEIARDVCEDLSARTNETVNLAVLRDGEVVSIEQINLSSAIISVDWVGQFHPLHATATGKVFLAFGSGELHDGDTLDLPSVTPHTLTDPELLRKDLEAVREQGYAITVSELEMGLNAVAAPVRQADGSLVAAIVISGPEYRFHERDLHDVGGLVRAAAESVSRRLGWLA
ncbi:IclR family transcriptional regulator [Nitriliruptor alkaliphilus]|uniref:IclR family transcriptional regulator n=1 Tax=Nitriliruptor alkaliphilus TaxID=427918 RepID=UPI000697D6A8|nr:IclR family transcriptional regulator [Nitriliruptor alkaliphilus]